MKKIFIALLLSLFSLSLVNSYSEDDLSNLKSKYKPILEKKFSEKIKAMGDEKKEKLILLIDKKINVFNNNSDLSDPKKLKYVGVFSALKDIVGESLEKQIIITVISDKKCSNCNTEAVIAQLEYVDYLEGAEIITKDFSDEGVADFLQSNKIKYLPAVIFNRTYIDIEIDEYLYKLSENNYNLDVGSSYNPFIKRSDKGFHILSSDILVEIISDSYVNGNKDAEITWIEYSDLECPYCAKLYKEGTYDALEEKYGDKLNSAFQHFPLSFHQNALPGAIIMECVGELSGTEDYYSLKNSVFASSDASREAMLLTTDILGVDRLEVESCISSNNYETKINNQVSRGIKLFGVSGTPASILINNKTGEYQTLSGAYPARKFIEIIDSLLINK